ncbi:uncharacterized protein N7498_008146 [Penicillium cinerascens]|uniref:Uncharacterized protein n=1 Tax=Penicillium cinerascens TaxID=70096 RepID=A0A9W9MAD9_9EURO|nr:uncharacterized protein N7498_008146 [Penicillium cinerascens]KAJ5194708.1 hypothetical protein N7498_008146 [Penicillium cinerascens]
MVIINNSNLDKQSTCPAQLGNFSKLPTELQLMIWEFLLRSIYARSHPEARKNILSILCCSRYLCQEISYLVYEDMVHGIHPHPSSSGESCVDVDISTKRLIVKRKLKNDEAFRRHILNFPHDRIPKRGLGVYIKHPSRNDPGHMVQMWHTINRLVDVLNALPRIHYVYIQLTGKWNDEKTPKQSAEDLKPCYLRRYDRDIALLPFFLLREFKMATNLRAVTLDKEDSLTYRLFHLLCEPHLENVIEEKWGSFKYESEAKMWLTDTRIFLDTVLDCLPGPTATLLRLERFNDWYKKDKTWGSAYGEQFVSDLINNRETVLKYDPDLIRARWRHVWLILTHHTIYAPTEDPTSIDKYFRAWKRKIYTTWNSSIWFEAIPETPCGIDIPRGDISPDRSHEHIH